ncbi:MAG: hypothetical protein ACOZF0_15255 [Thermodesulfobacteriota bacterium]
MRQKFLISRESLNNKLNIKEYAIIQRALRKTGSSMACKETFSFLCEETYEGSAILSSIREGMATLVATLRTRNLFPIAPHAIRIAESVMDLYDSKGDGSIELLFDGIDLFEKLPVLECR